MAFLQQYYAEQQSVPNPFFHYSLLARTRKRSLTDVDAYDILKWTNKKYPIKKIYVSENGVAYNDSISSDCRASSANTSGNILRFSDRPPLSECKLAPSGTLSPRNQYTLSQNLSHVR
jgi:hypothetical protein